MAGIFPDTTAGAIVTRTAAGIATNPVTVRNAHSPAATFLATCALTALPSDCTARFSPNQINAIVSEMVAFAENLSPTGTWDCNSLTNLSTAFGTWSAATLGASLPKKFTTTIGNGVLTSIPVAHNLGTKSIVASVFATATDELVLCDVTATSASVATFSFASAPASNAYLVTILG